jgi:sialate O-acetylesterase
MIAPITRFAIKGVVWYQGCSNGQDKDYDHKMEGLVLGWRKAWGYDFPFYYVQLASVGVHYGHFPEAPAGGTGLSEIREAQRRALRIPKTGMAVAIDIGDPYDIHPKCKVLVGERLALWALAKDYGRDVVFSGPLVKKATAEKNASGKARVRVAFDYVGPGLMAGVKNWKDNSPVEEDAEAKGALRGFSLKDASGEWFYADAAIDGADVVVSAAEVKEPVAIRYAHRACPLGECSLYNRAGLPASPFSIGVEGPAD